MKKYPFRDELQKRKLNLVLTGKTAMTVRNSHKSTVRISKFFLGNSLFYIVGDFNNAHK